ncbi:UvrD-family helicase [Indivirus ILV1]|uniref:UvrD-family helicase n=1 Tax=Indivirus ILV1 TaxID=1977633 RepID=A0A1V0SCU6_9VIRU|nr:UvrD-family helicase [Indivirus ILV1]
MNLSHFFGENGDILINHEKPKSKNKKKENYEVYKNLMNKFLSNNILDMQEYTFMNTFADMKGPLVNYQKYNHICKKITANPNLEKDDDALLTKISMLLFDHLNNIDNIYQDIEKYYQSSFTFTKDQIIAIKHICDFLYDINTSIAGMYGFAGTGKTTTITKLINYLLSKKYINSVVFTAPTNKAVNVLKSKFRFDLDDLIIKKQIKHEESFNDMLDMLEDKGYKVNFLTIHKLLNYQNDFDIEGERIFIKGDKTTIDSYGLVIVDECSMIPFQIIVNLVEEATKKSILITKTPKVLFIGDPAQLPPVNEIVSSVFAKKISELDFNLYKRTYITNNKGEMNFDKNLDEFIKKKFDVFTEKILSMKYVVLKEVMRSNSSEVIGLCNEMRAAVLNEIKVPKFSQYAGKKVYLYKYNNSNKMTTPWFKKCVEYFRSMDKKQQLSNIILTWTNKQTDEYNDTMRKTLYNKSKLDKFEIGDILILTDFYNMTEDDKNKNKRFYSSEQIKITDIEKVTKVISEFTETISKKVNKIKSINVIIEKYTEIVKYINKNTFRKYNAWKLYVHKLSDVISNTIPETHQIYVVDDNCYETLLKDRKLAANKIRELRNYYKNVHKEHLSFVDKNIIMPLWKELNKKLVDPFAKVNIAMSITTHRCQGSNYYNVFVDAHDILKNGKLEEAKRCLYTALSRTSNELHVLI